MSRDFAEPIAEPARAKVNLTLLVAGRRSDGYHELESLVAFADAGESVALMPDAPVSVTVTGPFAAQIAGANLLERTLELLSAVRPRLRLGAVALDKRLPVAAGLGGGSADAAALLRAVRRLNPAEAAAVDWAGLAARLGADVPACLLSRASLVWGTGSELEPLAGFPPLAAVLVNSGAAPLPDKTAQVFAGLRAGPTGGAARPPARPGPFRDASEVIAYLAARRNDLAAPARSLMPAAAAVESALAGTARVRRVGLSGAGPTCFGLFDTASDAQAAAASLARDNNGWWVASVVLS